ncbi:MAG: hypothetical protein Q8K59_11110 [Nitrosomonas sp.]|nr:hypothetical protein [Nitrosomonas sp.]MDP1951620.1 hypothetical protein [Nitrosomonas sp.]
MQTKKLIAVLIVLGFLASSSQIAAETRNATDAEAKVIAAPDHEKLAGYYENQAREMREKAEEQKKLLGDYNAHSYYYGREGSHFQSHHRALLLKYEKAAERNMNMAKLHRKMISQPK